MDRTDYQHEWSVMPLRQKLCFLYHNIMLEPMIACYMLAGEISSLAVQNLILDKACRVNLQYPKEICDALSARRTANYKQEEINVQKAVAGMAVWTTVIQSVIPAVLVIFIGSWSDRTGKRKICMLIPILGQLATAMALILCTYFFDELPMRTTAFLNVFLPAITGGWFIFSMGAYSFLAETTSVEMRTVRIGALSIFCSTSVPFGTALSGILIESVGFYGVFMLAAVFYVLAILYCCSRIQDVEIQSCENEKKSNADTPNREHQKWWIVTYNLVKDVFKPTHFLKAFEVLFKNGSKERRFKLVLLIVVLAVVYGPFYGEASLMYIFMRYQFNWNGVQFSMFSTYNFITHLAGKSFSVWVFIHKMKINDAIIGVMSCSSKILAGFVYAFARTDWQVYLAPLVDIINGTSFIAMRSMASMLVPPEELGKLNSLYGACESLTPLLYGPLYALVYTETLHSMPGAFFLLGGALTLPAVFIFGWMYNENRKDLSMTTGTPQGQLNMTFEHDLTTSESPKNA